MIDRLLKLGVTDLFAGLRQGRPALTGLGTAMALFAFMRRRRPPAKELLYGVNLKDGESVRIRFLRGGAVVEPLDEES
jgi:hypothetical protein